MPDAVAAFLAGRRFAVAGVSRQGSQPANAILRKLRSCGYDAVPINPHARELEGGPCYPDLASVPGPIDGVVIATAPAVSLDIVRQCGALGITRLWFHRSFGEGSVSQAALQACAQCGISPIVGGCPLMFCETVDLGHRCMRWWLNRKGVLPV